jgi:pimeloyl-ACP methyl ester carboxylesterase
MPNAMLNGISIAYDDVGKGNDVVILVHGHPFDRSMWTAQHRIFTESDWRAIAPDLRGYGDTSVTPGKTLLSQFAQDITALADHLGVTKFVIVGLSMGGQIAMEVCRSFPERIRGLVLMATFPQAETEQGRVNRNAMADRLLREGLAPYAHEVLPKMVAPRNIASLPDVGRKVLEMMCNAPPEGAAAALRGRAERPEYSRVLARLQVPALVVVGDEDAFTTRADADFMHALLEGSQLLWMKGIGHMPNLEGEKEFNATFAAFLNSIFVRSREMV